MTFRNSFGESIFRHKYALTETQTWEEKADDIVKDVTTGIFNEEERRNWVMQLSHSSSCRAADTSTTQEDKPPSTTTAIS
jgi:hypothetical protein